MVKNKSLEEAKCRRYDIIKKRKLKNAGDFQKNYSFILESSISKSEPKKKFHFLCGTADDTFSANL